MSFTNTLTDLHTAPPKKPFWKKALLPAGLLVLGIIIGTSSQPAPQTVEVEKVIEKEVPGPERIVTEEVEVKVPVTPAACLEALDLNEQAFTYASESLNHILDGDMAAAGSSTTAMRDLTPRINAAKAECRGAAS